MRSRTHRSMLAAAVAVIAAAAAWPSAAQTTTIPLDVTVGNTLAVSAAVSVEGPTIQNDQLVVTASVNGSATIAGTSATIATQPITVTASATCSGGTGTLTLRTSQISATLSTGQTVTVAPLTVTASASCGKKPTLGVTLAPASVTVSDGTTVSTSQCSATAAARASTTLGGTICQTQQLICNLASAIANGSVSDAVAALDQALTNVVAL